MSLKLLAVQSMTLLQDDPLIVCTIVPPSTASSKVKSEGVFCHIDGDQVTVSAITVPSAGATIPDPGPYIVSLNATAVKIKDLNANKFILRENDISDTINATPQIPASPSPTPYPVSFKIEIITAGQTKVKGE